MDDILKECIDKMQKALDSFSIEISKIRGGTINKSIFDDIKVDYYGAQTPLNQLCNINTNEASSIILSPYDASVADEIVKSCLLYTSPSPRDLSTSRMPSSA